MADKLLDQETEHWIGQGNMAARGLSSPPTAVQGWINFLF